MAILNHTRLHVYTRYTRTGSDGDGRATDDAVAIIEEVGDNTEDQLSLDVC